MAGKVVELAGCIILDEQNRILLIHRNTKKFVHWELPGGKVELNESLKMAAVRELREELNVHATDLCEVGDVTFKEKRKTYHYTWFTASIQGEPAVQEHQIHDDVSYFSLYDFERITLSTNAVLLQEELTTNPQLLVS